LISYNVKVNILNYVIQNLVLKKV